MPALPVPAAVALATAQPDEAHELLAQVYASHRVRLQGRVDRFQFRFRDNDLGDLSRSVLEHSHASVITDIAPFGHVVAGRILAGTYTCRMGPDQITASQGDWFLVDPDLPSDMTWSPDVKILTARFDRATLDRLTAGLSGHEADEPVRYPLSPVRSPEHARTLDQLDRYLQSLLADEVTRDSPLIRDQAARLMAAHLLEAFPIAVGRPEPEPGDHAGPASLRRALAFIDDHHDADIGLAEIAGAARVSPRALQQEFRRHENITPLAYLRRARLAAAHRDLAQGDPDTGITVSDVAVRWGFANPGRFATAYREAYGQQPSQTLYG
jgi:AraC-like DNA-binding protein